MSGEHSILSPSKGAMILRCAASLAAGKGAPNPPSEYSAEGTAYHEIAAMALGATLAGREWGACTDFVGQVVEADGFKFTIDEENAAHAQKYVDAIRSIPGQQFYEVRLDTSEVVGVPGQGGTGDAVTLDFEHDTIHVDDLKFGRGEVVFAEKNEQLLQYGAAALQRFALLHPWKHLKVAIHQPRIAHYSEATYTVDEVEAWVAANRPKFRVAYDLYEHPELLKPEDFSPGEKQCRWCPIRSKCAARANAFLSQFPVSPPAPAHPAVVSLSDAEVAAARDRVDAIEQWCSDIKAEAHTRGVLLGKHLPGWKVVIGRAGNRKWDEDQVNAVTGQLYTVLLDDAYKPKQVITPAEAEKAFKKKKLDFGLMVPFITQSEGSKSLVRDDSPKQAVAVAGLEFPVQEAQP